MVAVQQGVTAEVNKYVDERANSELVKEWKRIFETYRSSMRPNRKTGSEVDSYFRGKYPYSIYKNEKFKKAVAFNIVKNEHSRNKLPEETKPDIKGYCINDVFVGIDVVSGEFHVESNDISKAIPIYDDLFIYRGLDEEDLDNYFLVAEYIRLR